MSYDASCHLCGRDVQVIAELGQFLKRVNEKGVPGIWECSEQCGVQSVDNTNPIIKAIEATT